MGLCEAPSVSGMPEIRSKFSSAFEFGRVSLDALTSSGRRPGIRNQADERRAPSQVCIIRENQLLEMVASGSSLCDVLNALCEFVERSTGDCFCGILIKPWLGVKGHSFTAPSLPPGAGEEILCLSSGCETEACARVAHLKTEVTVMELQPDRFARDMNFHATASAHELRFCWLAPVYSLAGRILGTLAVYRSNPARPSPFQQDLIAKATHIASIAMERAGGEVVLRRSEAFLAEAQRLSSTGSFSWRMASDEIVWSDQLYRIFELDKTTPLTRELICARVHPEDVASMYAELVACAQRDGGDVEQEYRLVMADHSVKYVHMVAHSHRDQNGSYEYIGAVQDVTRRRLSEDALDRARSELAQVARAMSIGAFAASVAHEINQPLSGVITNANVCLRMLDADPPEVERAGETVNRILRDGKRASEVVTRLRALFSKSEMSTDLLDLNEAAREVITLSLSEFQRNGIILRTELEGDLPLIPGDRVQLQQVIMNLLQNASDAMASVEDRAKHLVIGTEQEGADTVRLSVKDAGVGLDFQNLERLFQPFYTTKSEGMGIGLFVSRSIIERHDGCLNVTANEGPGVTFSFSVPSACQKATMPPSVPKRFGQ
jgi:signal transduction histidine kinase